jgi:hypothetical protein
MNRYSKSEKGVGRKPGKLLCFALFAAALFLLPATARADSGGTYDLTGTFGSGSGSVTINSGSSFTYSGTSMSGTSITTSTDGTFDCPADATPGTCTLYTVGTNDEFGINNGTYYLVIAFPGSDLGMAGPFNLTTGMSYIKNDSTGALTFLTSGTAMSTPEPGTWLLMLSGIAGLFFFSLRRVHA